MASVVAGGSSASWTQNRANVLAIVTKWLQTVNEKGDAADPYLGIRRWEDLPSALWCCRLFAERFSHYLIHVYVIPKGCINPGQPLAEDNVINYLRRAIIAGKDKFQVGANVEAQRFLQCLDGGSGADAVWLASLQEQCRKIVFNRAKDEGKQMC